MVFKTKATKNAFVLRIMKGKIGCRRYVLRPTRTGKTIMVLKKKAAQKGTTYKVLAQVVLGEEIQVRAVTATVTLQCKNLNEIKIGRGHVTIGPRYK